jgi:hypothetical protein
MRNSKKNTKAVLLFSSVLEGDSCTLIIDGKKYLDKRVISTDRSLGIDLNNVVKFEIASNGAGKLEVSFSGNRIDAEPSLPPLLREVSLDTTI